VALTAIFGFHFHGNTKTGKCLLLHQSYTMAHPEILQKAIHGSHLSLDEGMALYSKASTAELMFAANQVRKKLHPDKKVTWLIDRNVNYTNVCVSGCQFCNFYRGANHKEAYITTIEQYKEKIDELFAR
jgi:cyclic dehypoxanthinyl futalosine synthase